MLIRPNKTNTFPEESKYISFLMTRAVQLNLFFFVSSI